jgi:TolB-like protein
LVDIATRPAANGPIVLASEPPFELGSLTVTPALLGVAGPDGTLHKIEPRAMQVLVALVQARGDVVSRETLNLRCWQGRKVTGDALDRVIGKLRQDARSWGEERLQIETVPRVGFRIPPIAALPPNDALTAVPATTGLTRRRVALTAGVVVLAGAGAATWLRRTPPRSAGSATGDAVKVAVLPFDNLSGDPALGFLAAGIARQIRDQLSRVSGLRVLAEASSSSVSAGVSDARGRAERLGAAYLVQGSVLQAVDRIRITAALIDASTGTSLWIDQREGKVADLFALQDALSAAALRELVGRAGVVAGAIAPSQPVDGKIFRMLLEGEDLFEQCRSTRMEGKAESAFDHADRSEQLARDVLAIDPRNSAALLLLARLTRYGWSRALARQPLSPEERAAQSLRFITQALSVDPNDPAALTALGDYYRHYEWRWREAETLFRKALAINPSYIEAHWSYGYQLGTTGRALEGLRHAATVYQLDPDTTWRRVALPRLLYLVGDRAGAQKHYAVELADTPANIFLIVELYIVALSEGDAVALDRLAARVRSLNAAPSPRLEQLLARIGKAAAALRGSPDALIAAIDTDVAAYDQAGASSFAGEARAGSDLLYIYAVEYAWAGAGAQAIAMFKRAFPARSLYWPATLPFGIAPLPAALRNDPRYRALWASDPGLETLRSMRERALTAGQMAGMTSEGRQTAPTRAEILAAQRLA